MSRRILLLITDLEIGGTPTVVREIAVRLNSAADAHVQVACLSPWGPVADQLRDAGVKVTAFGARGALHLPAVVGRLVSLLRQDQIDTVFSFLLHANAVAAVASAFSPDVRFIQSIQGSQPRPRWHWSLHRLIHPAADKVVVPSRSSAQAAMAWSRIPSTKIVVIHNAVDADAFAGIEPIPPQRRPYPIGFIGRLDPLKRIGDLVAAAALLRDVVHLHIFGDGVDRPLAQAAMASRGLETHVTMHGSIARPRDALAQIGILVLPSEAEGFGLVLIEAMAAGVPVVATDVSGIRDVVRHEYNGLLVPVRSPDKLAGAIRRLIDDQDLRRRLTANAAADVRSRFSWTTIMSNYRRLLKL